MVDSVKRNDMLLVTCAPADEQSSSQSDSDSDRSLDVSDSASDSDSDGNLAPFKKHTGPSSSDDKDDCLGAECNDDKTGKSSDEGQSDDKDPKDIGKTSRPQWVFYF